MVGDIGYIQTQAQKEAASVRYILGGRPRLPAYLRRGSPEIMALIEEMWRKDFRARPAMKDVVARLEEASTLILTLGGVIDSPVVLANFEGGSDLASGGLTGMTEATTGSYASSDLTGMTAATTETYAKSESKLAKSEKDALLTLLAKKDVLLAENGAHLAEKNARLLEMQTKIQELEATQG